MSVWQKGDHSVNFRFSGVNNGKISINYQSNDHPGEYLPPDVRDRLWREEVVNIIRKHLVKIGKTEAWLRSLSNLEAQIRFNSLKDFLKNGDRNFELYEIFRLVTLYEPDERMSLKRQIVALSEEKNIRLTNDLDKMNESALKITLNWLEKRKPLEIE